jgi:hypothetical protein
MKHALAITKHAKERMVLRSVPQSLVEAVLNNPDRTTPTDKPNTTKFIKTIRQREIQVITRHLPLEKKTLVISVWVRGEDDPEDLTWRIISFPFALLWKLLVFIWKKLW